MVRNIRLALRPGQRSDRNARLLQPRRPAREPTTTQWQSQDNTTANRKGTILPFRLARFSLFGYNRLHAGCCPSRCHSRVSGGCHLSARRVSIRSPRCLRNPCRGRIIRCPPAISGLAADHPAGARFHHHSGGHGCTLLSHHPHSMSVNSVCPVMDNRSSQRH